MIVSRIKLFASCLYTACLLSCVNPGNSTAVEAAYFDTHSFFMEEIERLSSKEKIILNKTAQFKGAEETIALKEPDWRKELALFLELDIANVIYVDKFEVDSTWSEERWTVNYKSLDEKTAVREVSIVIHDDSLFELSCYLDSDNILYSYTRKLHYQPSKGFKIEGKQKTRFLKEMEYMIEGKFESSE